MNPAEFANIAAAEQQLWWYRGMERILLRVLAPWANTAANNASSPLALEAGCGTGYTAKLLGERLGWRMVPLDLGREGLEFARSLGVRRLVQGDICSLPFGTHCFDWVVSMDVIVHLPQGDEGRAFREFVRVLRPGGRVAIRVSALNLLRSRHSEFAHERQRFTRKRLIEAARSAGLRVLRCTYANSLLLPVAVAKFRVWEPLTRQPPASGVQPVAPALNRALLAPLVLESAWLGTGRNLPLGQSLILIAESGPL